MPTKLKLLLLALSLFCFAVLAVAFGYQNHLRFVMGDWARRASPSEVVEFSATSSSTDKSSLVLDGLYLPFAESEITAIRCVSFADSGIDSTRHPPTTKILMCHLTNGIEVEISFPEQGYVHVDALLHEFHARTASSSDFSWWMTSSQLDELCNKISYQVSRSKVKRIGLRSRSQDSAIFRDYGTRMEVEWLFNEGHRHGCIHFSFVESLEFQNDNLKQLKYASKVQIVSTPKGCFQEEVDALIERIGTRSSTTQLIRDLGSK